MDGFVISDADAVAYIGTKSDEDPLERGHGFVGSEMAAALAAFSNGTTISLEDTDPLGAVYATQLPAALAAGTVTLDALRAAARRALLPRFRVGLYDPPERVPWSAIPASVLESAEHHALARRAARESFVLLQNNRAALPLAAGVRTVALVGPTSNCSDCGVNRYSGHPNATVSIRAGLAAACAATGRTLDFAGEALGAAATAALLRADAGVVVLTGEREGESQDRFHIGLPAASRAWLAELAAARAAAPAPLAPLIVLLVSGGALDSAPALAVADAALALHFGGMELGSAVADVLLGAYNPSGALAATVYRESWENASDFLSMAVRAPPGRGHRWLTPAARAEHVLFPFGHGLSYTSWAVSVLSVSPRAVSRAQLAAGAQVTLALRVANTGASEGARVAFALASRLAPPAGEAWPTQWLPRAGFAKVHGVAAGAAAEVNLTLGERDFARWGADSGSWEVAPGQFSLAVRDCAAAEVVTVT